MDCGTGSFSIHRMRGFTWCGGSRRRALVFLDLLTQTNVSTAYYMQYLQGLSLV